MKAQRVNQLTFKCHHTLKPCSNSTRPENTICYPPDELHKCPLTDIRFVSEYEAIYFQQQGYTVEKAYSDTYLISSRTHGDNLPLMTTVIDTIPCLDPNEKSAYYSDSVY